MAALSERASMAAQLGSSFLGAVFRISPSSAGPERARVAPIRAAVGAVYPRNSSPKKNRGNKDHHSSRRPAPSRPEVGSFFRDASPAQLPPSQRLEAARAASVCDAAPAEELKWAFDLNDSARSPRAFALEAAEEASASRSMEEWLAADVGQSPLAWQRSMLETHWLLDAQEREQQDAQRRRRKKGGQDAGETSGDLDTEAKLATKAPRKRRTRKKRVEEEKEQAERPEPLEVPVEEKQRVVVKGSASARARRMASRKQGSAILAAEAAKNLSTLNLKEVCSQRGDDQVDGEAIPLGPAVRVEGPSRATTWHDKSPEDANTSQVWSFMRDIGFAKLLTKEEEVELSSTFRAAQALKEKREKLEKRRGKELSHSEWAQHLGVSVQHLRHRLRAGERARERLIAANMRLVISVVKKYTRHGVLVSDLITAGTMGLAKGVDRFEPERGFKLSTYVHWWIRQAVSRAAAEHAGAFRLPMHVHETLAKVKRVKACLVADGKSPTTANIAESLGVSAKRISKVQKLKLMTKSLDESVPCPVGFAEGSSFHSFVHDPEEEVQSWSNIEAMLLKKDVAGILLSKLDARERDIISMHFGLKSKDGQGITLDNISLRYGVSRERIRQVETVAMRKLKVLCSAKDLKRYCY